MFSDQKELFEKYLENYFDELQLPRAEALHELLNSIRYSSLGGGKRFRPTLILLISEAFAVGPQRVLPLAAAVEMIHTYSLIHDDLPTMDNDDFRRGEPTNHKVYGEATALLAGDSLLSEAFGVIARSYQQDPHIGLRLIQVLSEAAGVQGMTGGQAIDLQSKKDQRSLQELNLMHAMKTGALIRVSCEGAAIACGLPENKTALVKNFGELIGLAFQLKDDLLDSSEKVEEGSFPALIGLEETQKYLEEVTLKAKAQLQELGLQAGPLFEIIKYNFDRKN